MILRLGLLLLLVLLAGSASTVAGSQTPTPPVVIQVSAAQRVQLAPADADAFQRRLNQPPTVPPPSAGGTSYVVTTDYWDAAVRRDATEPPVAPDATYFPAGGFVRARQAGQDAWFVIDLRQRAILDRYIRLARAGSIGPRPGALQVLAAASSGEMISLEAAGSRLADAEAGGFWRLFSGGLQSSFPEPPQPPQASSGYWLVVTLLEGRALHYYYDPAVGTLTDASGSERYTGLPAGVLPTSAPAPAIEQQSPKGSLLWWPVMIGCGVTCLAAAVWLRRRQL